jgi:hypothetical protein
MLIGLDRLVRPLVAGCIGFLAAATPGRALELVTPQEAALPPDQIPLPVFQGSPTRRPTVTVVSPAPNAGAVHSPVELKMTFEAHGGAKINLDSVVLTYKKTPEINITSRIKTYIADGGIQVPDAEVPPGEHQFRITLRDSNGHPQAMDFTIQVAK